VHIFFTYLVRNSWLPIVLALILLVGLDIATVHVWPNIPSLLNYVLYWAILTGLFVVLSEFSWRQYSIDELQLLTRLFMAGVFLGLMLAVYRGISERELWTLFNLAAEPLRAGLYAVLVGWIVANIQRDSLTNH
jgi:cytochrome bd-type quinol oxidase subunit 1